MGAVWLYNLFMTVIDVVSLLGVKRSPTIRRWLSACLMAGMAAMFLALAMGHGPSTTFLEARLGACGVFLHGTIVLIGSAVLLGRTRPKTAVLSVLIAVALLGVAADGFLFEPTRLEVTTIRLPSPKITHPLRIAVVADIQVDEVGDYEREVLRRVADEKPDLVLFAGDYIQANNAAMARRLERELNGCLHQAGISAARGAFAIRGNVDPNTWAAIFADLPVTVVQKTAAFDLGEVRLTCLGLDDAFDVSLEVPAADPNRYHIVLGHAPDFVLGKIAADLAVAGHTHGGQICLPWFGPSVTNTHVPRAWASGLHRLPGGLLLLVSRGIGMERGNAPRMRFLCRPELVLIELVPEE